MKFPFQRWLLTGMLLGLVACSDPDHSHETDPASHPNTLTQLPLNDLSAFQPTDINWSIQGDVYTPLPKENAFVTSPGTGILVNQNTTEHRKHIFTNFEHEDIELELDFMMAKGSNSGIYFQGRYEIQLFDSWQVENPQHSDVGGIYQRWDDSRPEGEKGYEGHAPKINAALAPGLWQHLRVIFRAPRFDENGRKVENARFIEVILNGMTIHEDVEVFGATRASAFIEEVPAGPLMIQGDHGPVAFRNIRYRLYSRENMTIKNLTYKLYNGHWQFPKWWQNLPDFDEVELTEEGKADYIDIDSHSKRDENFGLRYEGNITIKQPGDYAFTVVSDDGSKLYIDDQMVADHDGIHPATEKKGTIRLEEGNHDFRLDYFQQVGGQFLQIFVEGPGMPNSPLMSPPSLLKQTNEGKFLEHKPGDLPEMLRGFAMFQGEKRTKVIHLGDPSGINYAYDLDAGSLLKVWRGGFVNVGDMWENRGISQLAVPLAPAVEIIGEPTLARIDNMGRSWPDSMPDGIGFHPRGYTIDGSGYPAFSYSAYEILVEDKIVPDPLNGVVKREISFSGASPAAMMWGLIARGKHIRKINQHQYSIGGNYYIIADQELAEIMEIRTAGDMEELIIPVMKGTDHTKVAYSIVW